MEAVVTRFSVHAIEVRLNRPKSILAFLRNLDNSVGLEVYNTNTEEELAVPWIMETSELDVDDGL